MEQLRQYEEKVFERAANLDRREQGIRELRDEFELKFFGPSSTYRGRFKHVTFLPGIRPKYEVGIQTDLDNPSAYDLEPEDLVLSQTKK